MPNPPPDDPLLTAFLDGLPALKIAKAALEDPHNLPLLTQAWVDVCQLLEAVEDRIHHPLKYRPLSDFPPS